MLNSISWTRALTLSERDFFHPESFMGDFDAGLARQRVERWKRESALLDPVRFALRLEQQGLDEARFTQLLGRPAPMLAEPPVWLRELEKAYSAAPPPEGMSTEGARQLPEAVFLDVVHPLLDRAWHLLERRFGETGLALGDFARLWAGPLPLQLLRMVTRVLILELHLNRLEGRLEGATSEERFESFLAPLRESEHALELLATYPVLGRALVNRTRQWVDRGVELAERLSADLPLLEETFGGPLGDLVEIHAGLGDSHDDGRTVASLTFSSGTKILYKPRSLALDVVFQELLVWLGEQGIEPRLRPFRVLDRGPYGWVEFIEQEACQSTAEVRRFYARQGVYLALLYTLEATDFHYQNIIAAGEHPMLIDLETLFQPIFADPGVSLERLEFMAPDVLRIGLLPRRSKGEPGNLIWEVSGLAAQCKQRRPTRELSRVGTDEMGFIDGEVELPAGQHQPTLEGDENPQPLLGDLILESFATAWKKLTRLRSFFLEPGGWFDRFAGLDTRVVLRPTKLYGKILDLSYHPDYLQDALCRERLLDKLWLDVEHLPYISQLIPSERQDLERGDLPLFRSRTDSRDLFTGSGAHLVDAFPESGLDLARRRLASRDETDLECQLALVRLALATAGPLDIEENAEARGDFSNHLLPKCSGPKPQVEESLAAARRLGERLETLALRSEEWIFWYSLRPERGCQQLEPIGYDLYNGLAGIALFFAQLGATLEESRFSEIARRALASARHFLAQNAETSSSLGGYSGLGSWIYTLTSLGVLWESEELLDEAETTCALVQPAIAADEGLDVIAGAAGCIAGLLAFYRHRPTTATLQATIACGDHLLARGEGQDQGFAWHLPQMSERPLTGFAHGAAGIAWALARLAFETGESRFETGAREALAYERSLFSTEHENWPDLRVEGWSAMHAWCHGASGIGLSRLDLLDILDDPELEPEIRAAVRATVQHGFGDRHCLCHGNFGNLELIHRAARRFGDPELQREADELSRRAQASLEDGEYRRGLDHQVDLPGLMTGLAGIGYGLLRLASPDTVPSVLLLEPPKR